jgi:hypothetical protein
MKCNLVVTTLATAMTIAAPTLAFANSHHHRKHPIAPYGYGTQSYSDRYGTYPSYTYDPDPNVRAQRRSDFNRGVDFPGNDR